MQGNPPRGELARYPVHALADMLALFLPIVLAVAGGRLSLTADMLASRCRAKLQINEISSAASATVNHIGLSVDSRGHEPSTAMSFGSTR